MMYFPLQPTSPLNGDHSPRENGPNNKHHKKDGPSSPRSDSSSHASTPLSKHKDNHHNDIPVSSRNRSLFI